MYTFIGMDEAGYGPNLGPLVISATKWELPDPPKETDLWNLLEDVLTCEPVKNDSRLHVGDSKQVYSTGRGIQSLEKSVLVFLSLSGHSIESFQGLWKSLTGEKYPEDQFPPWFEKADLELPLKNNPEEIQSETERTGEALHNNGIRLSAICSDVVPAGRFNDCLEHYGNKGITLTSLSLDLLKGLWRPSDSSYIISDKHGGRNRYDEYISGILDGEMIFRLDESMEKSVYRIGPSEIRFQTKAESHLPVALASMVSKYMRELSMELFNQFWGDHQPDLKPTKGYPVDARRFLGDIQSTQDQLGVSQEILWRRK